LKSTRNQLLAEENALGDRVFLQTPKEPINLKVLDQSTRTSSALNSLR